MTADTDDNDQTLKLEQRKLLCVFCKSSDLCTHLNLRLRGKGSAVENERVGGEPVRVILTMNQIQNILFFETFVSPPLFPRVLWHTCII